MNNIPFGIAWEKPAKRLREAIEVIKGLWESSPRKPMNYDGEFFKLRKAYMMISPERKPHPPVYVSSSARLTRKIVAEMSDGWIAHIHSPKTFEEDLQEIENNAKLANRDPKKIDKVAFLITALSKDEESGFESVRNPVGMELLLAQHILKRTGFLSSDIPRQLDLSRFTASPEENEAIWKFAETIDRRAIEQTSLFGTTDKCIETIEKFEEAGATHVELAFMNKNMDETFRLFEEKIIPHFNL